MNKIKTIKKLIENARFLKIIEASDYLVVEVNVFNRLVFTNKNEIEKVKELILNRIGWPSLGNGEFPNLFSSEDGSVLVQYEKR